MESSHLDNVVWHALRTRHAPLREEERDGTGLAVRYPPDVAIFGAIPDEPTAEDWAALARLVGPDGTATLFRGEVQEPEGWTRALTVPARQMVAESVAADLDPEAIALDGSDLDDVLALVAATTPGPFGRRTLELGGYVGRRDATGALVAMAGHRFATPGVVEVSAVCTADSHRGRGLASRLVRHVVARAAERGETVILHASADNVGAIRLYEALGFEHRRSVEAVALVPPSGSSAGEVALDACRAEA